MPIGHTPEPSLKQESQFRLVNRKSLEILGLLAKSPIFEKYGTVKARPARTGEEVTTIIPGNFQETHNTAQEGDWVVTGQSGEQYIVPREKFASLYQVTDKTDVYSAKGYCRAIRSPFKEPIKIMAPWGRLQSGDEKCMIADKCDASGKVDGEPYLVDSSVFNETYKEVKN